MSAPHFETALVPHVNNICEGSATRFQVKVTGDPRPEISVFHDKEKIDHSKKRQIKYDDSGMVTITFPSCTRDFDGTYKIVAKNQHGEHSVEAELLIEFDPTV